MNTKTYSATAWLSPTYADMAGQVEQLGSNVLAFTATNSDMASLGWVKVGTAEITVTYEPHEAMREKAAEAIRAQMQEAAAKYQAMQTELQERLNKLLAIGYEVTE
jgi:hypothetical protein